MISDKKIGGLSAADFESLTDRVAQLNGVRRLHRFSGKRAEDRRHAREFDMPTAIVTTPITPEPQPPVPAS